MTSDADFLNYFFCFRRPQRAQQGSEGAENVRGEWSMWRDVECARADLDRLKAFLLVRRKIDRCRIFNAFCVLSYLVNALILSGKRRDMVLSTFSLRIKVERRCLKNFFDAEANSMRAFFCCAQFVKLSCTRVDCHNTSIIKTTSKTNSNASSVGARTGRKEYTQKADSAFWMLTTVTIFLPEVEEEPTQQRLNRKERVESVSTASSAAIQFFCCSKCRATLNTAVKRLS